MNVYFWRHNRTYHSHSMIQEPCVQQEFYLDAIAVVMADNVNRLCKNWQNAMKAGALRTCGVWSPRCTQWKKQR